MRMAIIILTGYSWAKLLPQTASFDKVWTNSTEDSSKPQRSCFFCLQAGSVLLSPLEVVPDFLKLHHLQAYGVNSNVVQFSASTTP